MHPRGFPRLVWLIGTLGALAVGAFLLFPSKPVASAPVAQQIIAEFELGDHLQQPAFNYTPPQPLARLSTAWEPQEALILSMSLNEALAAPDIAEYQLRLLQASHHYLPIYVFCEHEQDRALAYFLARLERLPESEQILERTEFIDSRNLMRWTRDFGPFFAFRPDHQLVLLDPVYRNVLRDTREMTAGNFENYRRFITQQSDAMPADVASLVQIRYDRDVQIVRPPILLEGGDFIHDGRGNAFISTQTLARNGGNRPALTKRFAEYFGIKRLHVIETLPGATIAHIDMILKFTDEKTALIPEYIPSAESDLNQYRRQLSRQIQATLARNEAYLRKHLPEVRLIKVPMPPIIVQTRAEILREAQAEFMRLMALERGLVSAPELESLTLARQRQLETEVTRIINQETGIFDFRSEAGFARVMAHYQQPPFDHYLAQHSERVTRYRSYLNSVFLHASDGRQAFLIPQFTSPDPAEAARLKAWEVATRQAYWQARPDAEIIWINCDDMVSDMGFVHCTTITLPQLRFP